VLHKFRIDDWAEDQKDAQILIDKVEKQFCSKRIYKKGVWYLSKEKLDNESGILNEFHWIFTQFEFL